jgi:hypothetical protein
MNSPSTPKTAVVNRESQVPIEYLEELAADQRRNLHNSVSKLRSAAKTTVRERLDVKRNLREHFWPVAGVAALVGMTVGYNFTGMFTGR